MGTRRNSGYCDIGAAVARRQVFLGSLIFSICEIRVLFLLGEND